MTHIDQIEGLTIEKATFDSTTVTITLIGGTELSIESSSDYDSKQLEIYLETDDKQLYTIQED